jgi:small subunit ribosomal protein S16
MVKLRLRRKGRIHKPVYDIVAVDARVKRDGKFLEKIGFYDPNTTPGTVRIDSERAIYWMNVGAQPTDKIRHMLSYEGVMLARHMQFKGKTEEEIRDAVEKHKEVANARHTRRKDLRVKRKADKIQAVKDAEEAEKAKEAEAKAE